MNDVDAAAGWPGQIARAVAVVRSEAASYEAVSREGAESLFDDESDMPEQMVDRLMDAGLITPAASARAVDREMVRRAVRAIWDVRRKRLGLDPLTDFDFSDEFAGSYGDTWVEAEAAVLAAGSAPRQVTL